MVNKLARGQAATWTVLSSFGSMLALQGPALAQSVSPGVPVYQGTAFVTGVSSGCAAGAASVGDDYTILYRELPAIGNALYGGGVAFVAPLSSVSYVLPAGVALIGGRQTFSTVAAHAESPDVGPFQYSGSLDLTISPEMLTPLTPSVYITGTVGNMFGNSGCAVTIRAALALRP